MKTHEEIVKEQEKSLDVDSPTPPSAPIISPMFSPIFNYIEEIELSPPCRQTTVTTEKSLKNSKKRKSSEFDIEIPENKENSEEENYSPTNCGILSNLIASNESWQQRVRKKSKGEEENIFIDFS